MPTPEAAVSDPRDPAAGAIALVPHPAFGPGPLRSLHATAALGPGGCIAVEFAAQGDLARMRLASASTAPQRRAGLWRHTCFELFARRGVEHGYLEFNFAPNGDWAAWVFDDYRSGGREFGPAPQGIRTSPAEAGRWCLRAQAELGAAAAAPGSADTAVNWWLNLAAVIEAADGGLSYWAARHAGAQPDFHDRGCFCVPLRAAQPTARSRAQSR
ncbi:MAG TPA: hypothetical protein VF931_10145 [Steroidobacteraceae bacterium]